MIRGFVDTNVLIEVYRGNIAARDWLENQIDLALCSLTWLEFMEGAQGKSGQARCLEILAPLELVLLTDADQHWTMRQLLRYRLSHGIAFKDCLIASVSYRLQVPLYTRNVKDFLPILGDKLVIRPY